MTLDQLSYGAEIVLKMQLPFSDYIKKHTEVRPDILGTVTVLLKSIENGGPWGDASALHLYLNSQNTFFSQRMHCMSTIIRLSLGKGFLPQSLLSLGFLGLLTQRWTCSRTLRINSFLLLMIFSFCYRAQNH